MPVKVLDRTLVINITLVTEAILLLIATFWSEAQDIKLAPLLVLHQKNIAIGAGAGILMVTSSLFLLWLGKISDGFLKNILRWLISLRQIVLEDVAPIFSQLKVMDILIVASASGFCEEVFFRGVMQNQLGLIWTSIIFGLFHGPSLKHLSYGLWATLMGLFLGWTLDYTGSLWVPIIAHSLNNTLSLLYIRYCIKLEVKPN
jgi:membrane protease YdiL (CAAX protease family)